MNKKTVALTTDQYKEIIQTMKLGFSGCRPNERIATALMLEANLGIRISDILKLRLADIVREVLEFQHFSLHESFFYKVMRQRLLEHFLKL